MPRKLRYTSVALDADTTLDGRDIIVEGLFVAKTGVSTLTIPDPDYDFFVSGVQFSILNDTSGSITAACTNGFAQSGDSVTIATGQCAEFECVDDGTGGYIWMVGAGASPAIPVKATGDEVNTGTNDTKFLTPKAIDDSDYAKTAAIPVKATGAEINTGTDDAKFVTAKAILDSALSPGKAAGSDINTGTDDDKFVTAKAIADSTYGTLAASTVPAAWTPTLAWTTATPEGMTITARYTRQGKKIHWWLYIVSADPGNGSGKLNTIVFPAALQPADVDMHLPVVGFHRKDTGAADTYTTLQAYLDSADNTAGNRKVITKNSVVWADNEATELMLQGTHEIA